MDHPIELVHGLPRKELIEKITFYRRQGEVAERAVGFYLLDMQERHVYRPERDAARWAEKHLDLSRADKLILIARRLEELPEIDGAFGRGELPWTKVREIARIAAADTERGWLELARRVTSRELEEEVKGKKRGDRPGGGLKARRKKYVEKLRFTAEQQAVWEQAIRRIRSELPKGSTPDAAAAEMARRALLTEAEGDQAGRKTRAKGPFLVVFHRGKNGASWVDTEKGRREVDPATVEAMVRAGARTIEVRDIEGPGECSAIPFGKRGEVAPEERDLPVSPELKEAVLARDGRCLVCGSTKDLSPHHLDSHADGGKSDMARLCTLCLDCQGEVHQGDVILRVEEDGSVTALDRERKEIGKARSAAEVLREAGEDCPLETILRDERAPPCVQEDIGMAPTPVAERSLDGLPGELSATEWRALEDRLEWSPAHRSFLLRPPADGGPAAIGAVEEVPEPVTHQGVRPLSFDGFVGQCQVVENLLLAARAARERGEPLGHVLLEGPAGLGKTTLARLLARHSGSGLEEVVAGNIGDPHQLTSLLARLRKGQHLFLDEVHALPETCAECLYPALEDGLAHVVLREGGRTRALRIRLERFTLVAATTRAGSLSEPFRARFALWERLEHYNGVELAEVAGGAAARLGSPVSPEAAREVARRSKGTPREALRILERARDIAQVSRSPGIELAHVGQAAERLGIDENGLDRLERSAVKLLLARGRPMGVEAMAARLGVDLETFREVHEPWLERAGLIERTERGRVATAEARAIYGEDAEEAEEAAAVLRVGR